MYKYAIEMIFDQMPEKFRGTWSPWQEQKRLVLLEQYGLALPQYPVLFSNPLLQPMPLHALHILWGHAQRCLHCIVQPELQSFGPENHHKHLGFQSKATHDSTIHSNRFSTGTYPCKWSSCIGKIIDNDSVSAIFTIFIPGYGLYIWSKHLQEEPNHTRSVHFQLHTISFKFVALASSFKCEEYSQKGFRYSTPPLSETTLVQHLSC